MGIKKNSAEVCAFCRSKSGHLSPILLRKIEIETVNVFGIQKQLCTNCKNKFYNTLQQKYMLDKRRYSDKGLLYLRKLIESVAQ